MPVIAVDCDDTLSRTNQTICEWHNKYYKSHLTIDDFDHFQYWRVRDWGDRDEAMAKVHRFNRSAEWDEIPVIEEAIKCIKQLKEAGHKLVVITARMASESEKTRDFIEHHFPDCFDEIYFTSAFESRSADTNGEPQDTVAAVDVPKNNGDVPKTNGDVPKTEDVPKTNGDVLKANGDVLKTNGDVPEKKRRLPYVSIPKPKSEICKLVGAKLLIDDSLENAIEVHNNAGIQVALYGSWRWNQKEMDPVAIASPKSYAQRLADGEQEPSKDAVLPKGITRTIRWREAVDLAKRL